MAHAATQPYVITDFETVRIDAPVRVEIATNRGASGRGEGDRDMLDNLDLQVSGRSLSVRLRPGQKGQPRGRATLRLTTQALSRIFLNGGGVLAIDRLAGQQVQLQMNGNGNVMVNDMAVDRLTLLLSGNGRIDLAGKAGVVTARILGGGMIAAERLNAREVNIANDGPGSISMSAQDRASVVATGAGDSVVIGKPVCKVEQRGTGWISCAGQEY